MRIDAHQHFWMYSPAQYGWISDEMAELKRDFLPKDLKPLLGGQAFDGSFDGSILSVTLDGPRHSPENTARSRRAGRAVLNSNCRSGLDLRVSRYDSRGRAGP